MFGDVHAGACLNWPNGDPGQASVVPCTDDHLFEVADTFKMTGRQAPCQQAVRRYLGDHYDPTGTYTVAALWPSNTTELLPDTEQLLCGLELPGPDGQPIPTKGQVTQIDQSKTWPTDTCLGIDATNQPTNDAVDCAEPHAVEITGTANLGEQFSGPPPTAAEQGAYLEKACAAMAEEYLAGASLKASGLTLYHGTVTPVSWLAGSRRVPCGIGATAAGEQGWATLTGSVTGRHLINGETPVTATTAAPEPEPTVEGDPEGTTTATSTPGSEVPTSSPTVSTTPAETPTSQVSPPGPVAGVPAPSTLTPPVVAPVPSPLPGATTTPLETQPQGPRPGP